MKSGFLLLVFGTAAVLLAVVGFLAFAFWHVASLGWDERGVLYEAEEQFLAPGTVVVELAEPGDYMLWFQYRVQFQGEEYEFPPEAPPGLEVEMEKVESGEAASWVPFGEEMDLTVEMNGVARKNVGVFEVDVPGTYRVEVSGDFGPRVFSIATAPLEDLFGGIGTVFIVAIFVGLIGIVLAVFGFVLLLRRRS